jgi:hypothetical protein
MNAHYLWLPEGLELLTFFVIAPALAVFIAYRAWRDKNTNPKKSGMHCIVSGAVALPLLFFVQGRGVDLHSFQYFLLLGCTLLSVLLLGVVMGSGFAVLLGVWRWHNATRLKSSE